jgi:hypothetical protein
VIYVFFRKKKHLDTCSLNVHLPKIDGYKLIRVNVPHWLEAERVSRRIERALRVSFAMKIIIIMCWSIWTERNMWIFNNEDPTVENCQATFKKEFALSYIEQRNHMPHIWNCGCNL